MHRLLWIAALAAAAVPASALEVVGNVQTKLGAPIAGARVCVKSNPGSCVITGTQGEFRLSNILALRPTVREASGFSLSRRGGSLIMESLAAVSARLEWLSADGKREWAATDLRLNAGRNDIALPAGLPHAGLCILRLTTPRQSLAWKAVLAPGLASAAGAASAGAARVAALAKSMAAMLEVSKAGYRTRIYQPESEEDTAAIIHLSETADTGVVFRGIQYSKILSIDRTRKIMITADSEFSCDPQTGSAVVKPSADTTRYAIRGGQMWTWYDGDCSGAMMTGISTDPVGKWTLAEPDAPLPADLQTGCIPSQEGFISPLESYSAEFTITETGITDVGSDLICPGDYFSRVPDWQSFDSTYVLLKSRCLQLVYKNPQGDTGTFDFSADGDSLRLALTHKAGTCRMSYYFGLSNNGFTCPDDYGSRRSDFLACVANAGFGKLPPMQKTAVAPMSRVAGDAASRVRTRHGLGRLLEYISGTWKAGSPH